MEDSALEAADDTVRTILVRLRAPTLRPNVMSVCSEGNVSATAWLCREREQDDLVRKAVLRLRSN